MICRHGDPTPLGYDGAPYLLPRSSDVHPIHGPSATDLWRLTEQKSGAGNFAATGCGRTPPPWCRCALARPARCSRSRRLPACGARAARAALIATSRLHTVRAADQRLTGALARCPVTGSRAARSAESLTPPGHRGSRSRGMIVLDTIEVPFTDWMDARHHALVVALAWKSCCRSSSRG